MPFSKPFSGGRRGAALVEYAVLTGLIAVVSIGAISQLGTQNSRTYETISAELTSAGVGGGAGSYSVGGTSNRSAFPDDSACTSIPDDGGDYFSSAYGGASCFTLAQTSGNTWFNFENADARPIFISGAAIDPAVVWGDFGDNTVIVASSPSYMGFHGDAGYDVLEMRGFTASDVVFRENFGDAILEASSTTINLYQCEVDEIIFDDRSMTPSEYEAAGGFDCATLSGSSGPGGPPGMYDKYFVMDGCVVEQATNDYKWCPGSAPLPADLSFRQIHGRECAYDPAPEWDGWLRMMEITKTPSPDDIGSMACR